MTGQEDRGPRCEGQLVLSSLRAPLFRVSVLRHISVQVNLQFTHKLKRESEFATSANAPLPAANPFFFFPSPLLNALT